MTNPRIYLEDSIFQDRMKPIMKMLKRLEELFAEYYDWDQTKGFFKAHGPEGVSLKCPFACSNECNFKTKSEPSATPLIVRASGKRIIMVVLEAPSIPKRPGAYVGGKGKWDGNYEILLTIIEKRFRRDAIIVTELVKCGAAKQDTRKPGIIKRRKDNCFRELLSKELNILNPKYILCIGGTAQEHLRKLQTNFKIPIHIKLIDLIHPAAYLKMWKKERQWKKSLGNLKV